MGSQLWKIGAFLVWRIIRKLDNCRKKAQTHKKAQTQLRTEAFQAAHAVVDKASTVGSEDLTGVIAKKKSWGRDFNRRMDILGQRRSRRGSGVSNEAALSPPCAG